MRRMVRQSLNFVLMAACLPLLAVGLRAQEGKLETAPSKEPRLSAVYRVDYTIREIEEGKTLNSRKYTLMVESRQQGENWARSRAGNRVPIKDERGGATYTNVGMDIDCGVRERGDLLLLDSRIEISSVVPVQQAPEVYGATSTGNPVFRSVSSDTTAAVSLGKPTVIGIMSDVTSNRRFEIEATVTSVK